MQAQRCAHAFWLKGGFENDHIAFAIQDRVNEMFAVDIHPGALIGGGCFLDHGTTVVIGETSTIGRDCTILQGVTLGGTGKARTARHPHLRDRVGGAARELRGAFKRSFRGDESRRRRGCGVYVPLRRVAAAL